MWARSSGSAPASRRLIGSDGSGGASNASLESEPSSQAGSPVFSRGRRPAWAQHGARARARPAHASHLHDGGEEAGLFAARAHRGGLIGGGAGVVEHTGIGGEGPRVEVVLGDFGGAVVAAGGAALVEGVGDGQMQAGPPQRAQLPHRRLAQQCVAEVVAGTGAALALREHVGAQRLVQRGGELAHHGPGLGGAAAARGPWHDLGQQVKRALTPHHRDRLD